MKVCENCKSEFPFLVEIDGKRRNLGARRFCLKCSPFGQRNTTKDISFPKSKINTLSNDEFTELVKSCRSRTEIFLKLRMRKSGRTFEILNERLKKDEIDTSHFQRGCQSGNNRKCLDSDVYCENSTYRSLRFRVLKDNFMEYKCKSCGLGDRWNNQKLVLHLDHINGDRYDNRKENLRWLCPNCHTQTPTFSGRNL